MTTIRDEFLSEEDLDLRNLTDEEPVVYWNQWLDQAQATNEVDAHMYSHGVFTAEEGSSGAALEVRIRSSAFDHAQPRP